MELSHKDGLPAGAQSGAHDRLTEREREFIRHALGLSNRSIGYRNYFAAGGDDVQVGRALAARGLAIEAKKTALFPDPFFYITSAGFRAAQEPGEAMDLEERAKMERIDAAAARAAASVQADAGRQAAPAEGQRPVSGEKP